MDNKLLKINWLFFIICIFLASRLLMLYQYNLANNILHHNHSSFFEAMCKWDCRWYLTIIKDGYDTSFREYPRVWYGLANYAFFPLYPYLVKILSTILHINPVKCGIILNQFFILIALIFFYKYLKLIKLEEFSCRFGVFLLSFSPFSIYFSSLYTEALFVLLSILTFYFLRSKKLFISAILAGFLSATRPVGVMMSLVIFYDRIIRKRYFHAIIYSLIAASGLLLFMLYLHFHAGDYLAFAHIQKAWNRHGFDTNNLTKQLIKLAKDTHNTAIFLISLSMSIYLMYKRYIQEGLFNLFCILPGVLTGQMMSEGRFCGTLFTFYLSLILLQNRSRTLGIVIAVIFLILYVSYFLYWMARATFLV